MRISVKRTVISTAIVAISVACATSPNAVTTSAPSVSPSVMKINVATGEDVVRAMYDRYAGKWYNSLNFHQRTTQYDSTGTPRVTYWQERALPPGRLRIDVEPFSEGRGFMWSNDSIHIFRHDSLIRTAKNINPLLLLGFDIYAQPAATTIEQLRGEGFDVSKVSRGTWQGKAVWIVGAAAGDTTSNQFWVEQDRLLFVRLLEKSPSGALSDDRFEQYEPLGGGYVAPVVRAYSNGRLVQLEEYSNITTDPISPAVFDPTQWTTTKPKTSTR
jgi:hypothetical protein